MRCTYVGYRAVLAMRMRRIVPELDGISLLRHKRAFLGTFSAVFAVDG